MIQLEAKFSSRDGGFDKPLDYTQLIRNERAAVYSRSRDNKEYDFEVFLIKTDPKGKETKFPNGTIKVLEDDKEKYPSSSQFGRIAWSYGSRLTALAKFNELTTGKIEIQVDADDESDSETSIEEIKPESKVDSKPYTGGELLIPTGEFSTQELADRNKVAYVNAYLFVKDQEKQGKIQFSRKERRNARGKPTTLFKSIST